MLTAEIQRALDRAEVLMRLTGRAIYADGVGRLYDLLYERYAARSVVQSHTRHSIVEHLLTNLEIDVQVAINNLPLAVSKAPIHGWLIALR